MQQLYLSIQRLKKFLNMNPDGLFFQTVPEILRMFSRLSMLLRSLRVSFLSSVSVLVIDDFSCSWCKTFKMKFGHRGGNHPVMNMETGKIEITSQNHSYAVDAASLAGTELTLTHKNLLDDTAEGVESAENKLFSVQYHPESAPGPQDSAYLFDKFISLMEKEAE